MIKKAVFPVAGWGTRFLPATKASPKEMLPLVDKPLIQYTVEEAVAAGIETAIFITGRNKRAIEDHFDRCWELEETLIRQKKHDLVEEIIKISDMIEAVYVRQKTPLGLGHAVLKAKHVVGDEPFAVILGDDIIDSDIPAIKQLIDVYEKYKTGIVAIKPVPEDEVSNYGIVKGNFVEDNVMIIEDMVEKPSKEEAPSNYAVIGRYILTPDIFEVLEKTPPGAKGEIQLTDAMKELNKKRKFMGVVFKGEHFDCGSKIGYVKATIHFALKRDELKYELLDFIRTIIF